MIGPGFAAGVFAKDVCRIASMFFVAGIAVACAIAAVVWVLM